MDHKSEMNSSATGRSTDSVHQTALRRVSGEKDMHERVSETVGSGLDVGNIAQDTLGPSLSHVLCEKHCDQSAVNKTTVGSGHAPVFVDQSIMHVAGETVNAGSTTTHIDQLSSVLLAQQLPPLPKFSGESDGRESVIGTFQEWLEQFEMIANVCDWSPQSKLVNLITRLQGQAYAFF